MAVCIEVCSICLDPLCETDGSVHTTKCGHKFHSKCFSAYLAFEKTTCPCCMQELGVSTATPPLASSMTREVGGDQHPSEDMRMTMPCKVVCVAGYVAGIIAVILCCH